MEAGSERPLADPPATWQEHWFDHRQLLQLYHHDEHCAIYLDPDVRRAEIQSPAYEIWGDSKWAEFYIYDLYTALGMDREARGVYRRFTGNTDDFPRRRTRWFRDWFYPLWRDCGQAQVMNRFFRELARHFPRDSGGTYTRRMNWGEYVHFTSGAAAADMSGQAARAFGWPRQWAAQLEHAREQFPGITY